MNATLIACLGYLATMSLLVWLAGQQPLSAIDPPGLPGNSRTRVLDGLRGFLATGVFFHHVMILHRRLYEGQTGLPDSRIFIALGQGSVMLFFMITGFLFWSKWMQAGRLQWPRLWLNRLFRIGPLYWLTVLLAIGLVMNHAGWTLDIPPATLLRQLLPALAMGFYPLGTVNDNPALAANLTGMTWTLRYEWLFYLVILPGWGLLQRRSPRAWKPIAALWLVLSLYIAWQGSRNAVLYACFATGMLTAWWKQQEFPLHPAIARNELPLLALALLVVVTAPTSYNIAPLLALGLIFWLLIAGKTGQRLLTVPSMRRLGEISYGLYLLQGIVLTVVMLQPRLRSLAISGDSGFWLVVAAAAVLLLLVSTLAHLWLEKPAIQLGHRLAGKIG